MNQNRVRVLHIITKLAVGGAQMNTLISTRDINRMGYHSDILTGPERPPEGDLFHLADAWGLNVIIAEHLKRDISPLNDLLALKEIKRVIASGSYDIVHTHGSKARFLGRLAAASVKGVRIVQTAHGWPFYESMNPLKRLLYITLERIGFDLAHINICVSPRDRDKALRYGVGHYDDYRIIRSGVEFQQFKNVRGTGPQARELLGIGKDRDVVGSVMRFCPEKAPDIFLDVAERILKKRPDTLFVLVGDGPLFDSTRRTIESRNLQDSFLLTGSRDDVVNLLPAFDVFLITSRTEGLPRALLESLAAGIPVVSTDVGGIHELLREGRNGVLCDEGDRDGLANGVTELLESPDMGKGMLAEVDRDLVPFSASNMVNELYQLYTRLHQPGMRVVFLCDDEPFNIPRTVARIIRKEPFYRYTIVSLSGHGSMGNAGENLRRYLALYGPFGFFIQLTRFLFFKAAGILRLPTKDSHSLGQTAAREHAHHMHMKGSINSEENLDTLRSLEPDVIVSLACPQILRRKALSIPRLGCWNVHSAMLPRNRGMLPTFWSLCKGDTPGVTMHRMSRKLDDGDILLQESIDVSIRDVSLHQLLDMSKKLASEITARGLELLERGDYSLIPNPSEESTSNSFPTRKDVARFRAAGGKILGSVRPRPPIAISFDVEEWFQTYAARKWYPRESWDEMDKRVNSIMDTILDILRENRSKATFFFLGWIAEHHPDLLEKVCGEGHEIAYHGFEHMELSSLSSDVFSRNLDRFIQLVRSRSLPDPVGFRAPSFSMKKDTLWAIDEIVKRNFIYDSSIYPMFKIRYGVPGAPRSPFILKGETGSILELPLASFKLGGMKFPAAGGAYLRFYPGVFHRFMLRSVSGKGIVPVLYFHPWELDSLNVSGKMNLFQRIRQHHNSGTNTISKLSRILGTYRGISLRELAEQKRNGKLESFSM